MGRRGNLPEISGLLNQYLLLGRRAHIPLFHAALARHAPDAIGLRPILMSGAMASAPMPPSDNVLF